MSEESTDVFPPGPPSSAWTHALTVYRVLRVAHALVKLRIPEVLAAGPVDVAALAATVGADPAALGRVLRAACSAGIVASDAERRYVLTPLGELLRRDVGGSVAASVTEAIEAKLLPREGLVYSTTTGKPAFDQAHGMSFFAYLRSDERSASAFDANMALGASGRAAGLLEALGERPLEGRLVDVGGGSGTLAECLLSTYPRLHATVFDLPETVARAAPRWEDHALRSRIDLVGGDFFEAVPKGAEHYVLSFIVHDWDDERSAAILRNCRRAMTASSRLFIVEHVAEEGAEADRWELFKLDLLEMLGSGLRTEAGLCSLVARAGLEVAKAHRSTSGFTVLEAQPSPVGA